MVKSTNYYMTARDCKTPLKFEISGLQTLFLCSSKKKLFEYLIPCPILPRRHLADLTIRLAKDTREYVNYGSKILIESD